MLGRDHSASKRILHGAREWPDQRRTGQLVLPNVGRAVLDPVTTIAPATSLVERLQIRIRWRPDKDMLVPSRRPGRAGNRFHDERPSAARQVWPTSTYSADAGRCGRRRHIAPSCPPGRAGDRFHDGRPSTARPVWPTSTYNADAGRCGRRRHIAPPPDDVADIDISPWHRSLAIPRAIKGRIDSSLMSTSSITRPVSEVESPSG